MCGWLGHDYQVITGYHESHWSRCEKREGLYTPRKGATMVTPLFELKATNPTKLWKCCIEDPACMTAVGDPPQCGEAESQKRKEKKEKK